MEGSINTILIPFDCLLDLDVGLLSVIRDKYSNGTVFDLDKIKDTESIIDLVYNSEYYDNPLELILKPDYMDKKESFYNEFMEKEYESIIKNSVETKVVEVAKKLLNSKMGKVYFFASNEIERDKILSLLKMTVTYDEKTSYEKLNASEYDIVFLRKSKYIFKIPNLKGRYLYILKYKSNELTPEWSEHLDESLIETYISVLENNQIKYIDINDKQGGETE